jgi:hypothetical protein
MSDSTTHARGTPVAERASEAAAAYFTDLAYTQFRLWLRSVFPRARLLFALGDTALEANLRAVEALRDITVDGQQRLLQLWAEWAGASERTAPVSPQDMTARPTTPRP